MFDLFNTVSVLLKLDGISIDNNVCRLHYKVTVIMLIIFSLLLTSRQYFGDPIDCIASGTAVDHDALDTYCWISSTFTVTKHLRGKVGKSVAYAGVAEHGPDDEVIHHKYYQWVCFVLCFQAILFYIPRCIWKVLEGGRMLSLVNELHCPIVNKVWTVARKKAIADYVTSWKYHQLNTYAIHYVLCETLNFINVIGQVFLLNIFLGNQFFDYGRGVANTLFAEETMTRVFPKITKCSFSNYGPSGTLQNIEALCVLPLNIVNEKIFAFLWFWFAFLTVISAMSLIYRMALLNKRFRIQILYQQACMIPIEKIEIVANKCDYGDWFFISQLLKNMNPFIFKELFDEIINRFESDKSNLEVFISQNGIITNKSDKSAEEVDNKTESERAEYLRAIFDYKTLDNVSETKSGSVQNV